jgi:hypothetical protein
VGYLAAAVRVYLTRLPSALPSGRPGRGGSAEDETFTADRSTPLAVRAMLLLLLRSTAVCGGQVSADPFAGGLFEDGSAEAVERLDALPSQTPDGPPLPVADAGPARRVHAGRRVRRSKDSQ